MNHCTHLVHHLHHSHYPSRHPTQLSHSMFKYIKTRWLILQPVEINSDQVSPSGASAGQILMLSTVIHNKHFSASTLLFQQQYNNKKQYVEQITIFSIASYPKVVSSLPPKLILTIDVRVHKQALPLLCVAKSVERKVFAKKRQNEKTPDKVGAPFTSSCQVAKNAKINAPRNMHMELMESMQKHILMENSS